MASDEAALQLLFGVILVTSLVALVQGWTAFGKHAAGARLLRMQHSSHYRAGHFAGAGTSRAHPDAATSRARAAIETTRSHRAFARREARRETGALEARTLGGADSVDNLRLLCRAHNRLAAELELGAERVALAIERSRNAREPSARVRRTGVMP